METALSRFAQAGVEQLRTKDAVLFDMLEREYQRQSRVLAMVASSSIAEPSVLACEGTVATNVTTEGYPGARYHGGCEVVDEIERLAVARAKSAFGAQYANVQPHSGSSANEILMFNLLKPGDVILGMDLDAGGHLTHGAKASVSGRYFQAVSYGVNEEGLIDYNEVNRLAQEHRPKLLISGASCYPRTIDFAKFREIADSVGALLLADISHIAGLVVAGEHPSPIDHAHFTTTSSYKQLFGPRGGLILMGRDWDTVLPGSKKTLAERIQSAVFPYFQGTPHLSSIAAKARAFDYVQTPEFRLLAKRIVANSRAMARAFAEQGHRVVTGGSDNHIVLLDVFANGVTGLVAERALESCGIIVNKNRIVGDRHSALVTSGVRLGTNILALRGMGDPEMAECADLIHRVLRCVEMNGLTDYILADGLRESVRKDVEAMCDRFPLPDYPV